MIKNLLKKLIRKCFRLFLPEILPECLPEALPKVLPTAMHFLPEGWHNGYNVYSHVFVDNKDLVHIGKGSFLNHNTGLYVGSGKAHITIGENVFIANDCVITTCSHEIGTSDKRAGTCTYNPVIIEDGVWIGANSTILPGVTIGKGTIIAAGAVVTRDCLPNCLYAGVPAKKIRELAD